MLRSRSSAVTLAAVALVSVLSVSGCSMFQRTATSTATEMPSPDVSAAASVSVVTTDAAQPSATPTVAVPVGAPTPPTVPGYTLAPASATVVRKFQTVTGKFNGVFAGLTVRTVTKGRDVTGTVVLLGLHPELIGNTTVEKGLLPGMAKGMAGQGAKTSTQRVDGQDVAVAATKTTNIVAWYKGGTVVLVLSGGTNPAPTLAFAKAYLTTR